MGVKVNDVFQEVRDVLSRLPHGGLKKLNLYMVPNDVFAREAHGRYVRFAGTKFPGFVWDLDIGLRVFEGAGARERCKATFGVSDGAHRRVESELQERSKADWTEIRR